MEWFERLKSAVYARLPAQWQGRPYLFAHLVITLIALSAIGNAVVVRMRTGPHIDVGFEVDLRGTVMLTSDARARRGDTVETIDAQPVTHGSHVQQRLRQLGPNHVVGLTMRRPDGTVYELSVVGRPVLAKWWFIPMGVGWLLLALAILWFRPVGGAPLLLCHGCACLSLTVIVNATFVYCNPDASWAMFWFLATSGWLTGGSAVCFMLLTPYPLDVVRRWPIISMVMGATMLLGLLQASLWFLRWRFLSIVGSAASGWLLFSVAMIAILLAWRQRVAQPPKVASQLRFLTLAVWFTVPTVVLVLVEFVAPVPTWISGVARLVTVGAPATFAYLIISHDLLNIDKTAARVAIYGGSVLVVGALYVTAVLLVPAVVAPEALVGDPVLLVGVVASAALSWVGVSRVLKHQVTRYFRRIALTFEAKLRALEEVFDLLSTQPLAQAYGYVEALLCEVLEAERVCILEPAGTHGAWRTIGQTAGPVQTAEEIQQGGMSLVPICAGQDNLAALAVRGLKGSALIRGTDDSHILRTLQRGAGLALRFAKKSQRVGGYNIVSFLGAGGMGAVYLGVGSGLSMAQERVAIKQLLAHNTSEPAIVKKFLAEGEIAKQLIHPNIIRTLDVGSCDVGSFIAMEHLDGCDVRHLLQGLHEENRQLSVSNAVYITIKLCDALSYAHTGDMKTGRPGLLHRDVSPDNVLISQEGVVKLADFGIAALAGSQTYDASGKVGYIAPEVLRGDRPTQASDVFAAGVVLYEIIFGEHPFMRRTMEETKRATLKGNWIPLSSLRPEVSLELGDLVSKAMSVDPQRRFQGAAEMADALRAVCPVSDKKAATELGELAIRYGAIARQDLQSRTMLSNARTEELVATALVLEDANQDDFSDEGHRRPR